MLSNTEMRCIEAEMIRQINNSSPYGINTRILISSVVSRMVSTIPAINRHHCSELLAWILDSTNNSLIIRRKGYSFISTLTSDLNSAIEWSSKMVIFCIRRLTSFSSKARMSLGCSLCVMFSIEERKKIVKLEVPLII